MSTALATRAVRIREVGLRDGLQSIERVLSTDDKLAWISAEVAAGVREIEVCSFVPPKLMPQFADAADVVRRSRGIEGLTIAALVPNARGAEAALSAGAHKINYVISASEAHNRANVRRSREESLTAFAEVARLVSGTSTALAGGVSTAFGCTIQGRVEIAEVMRVVEGYLTAGAQELILADTVGYADPEGIKRLVTAVREAAPSIPLALHLHDTRGLGLANVVAGLQVGVCEFDAALGGMGGCPHAPGASGNIVTEDLVFLLESMGWDTGIDLQQLLDVRHILTRAMPEVGLLGSLAKAGLPRGFGIDAVAA